MNISVTYSEEDKAYIATCDKYPSLGTHGNTELEALQELVTVLIFENDSPPRKGDIFYDIQKCLSGIGGIGKEKLLELFKIIKRYL